MAHETFVYPTTFDPLPKKTILIDMQYNVALGLRGYVEEELRIVKARNLVRKAAEKEYLLRCGAPRS